MSKTVGNAPSHIVVLPDAARGVPHVAGRGAVGVGVLSAERAGVVPLALRGIVEARVRRGPDAVAVAKALALPGAEREGLAPVDADDGELSVRGVPGGTPLAVHAR